MKLIVVGAGSWTKNMIELFNLKDSIHYIFDTPKEKGEECWGHQIKDYAPSPLKDLGVISSIGDPRHKRAKLEQLRATMWDNRMEPWYVNLIHPTNIICESSELGIGIYMQPNGIYYANTKIGNHVSCCGAVNLGHDSIIGDYCSLAPSTLICGNVVVGDGVSFGVGSRINPGIKIGNGAKIGAGAMVIDNVRANTVVVGNPAKYLKAVKEPW